LGYTKANEHIKDSTIEDGHFLTDINDLIGFTLGDALKIALEKGYSIEDISITAPPRMDISEYDHSFRVLRVHSLGGKRLTILVCKPL
jgi:hypothetical protein